MRKHSTLLNSTRARRHDRNSVPQAASRHMPTTQQIFRDASSRARTRARSLLAYSVGLVSHRSGNRSGNDWRKKGAIMFHGQSGFATSHFKRLSWNSTPVQHDTTRADEAAARNLSNRVATELPDRSGGSYYWANSNIPLVWYSRLVARHWFDCLDFHMRVSAALVSRSTAV
jgi:hypothetical protein